MSWTDQTLADHCEGILDARTAARLEADLASDAALAARAAALRALLAEPVTLPELPLPDALTGRVGDAVGAELDALEAVLAEPVTLPEVAVPEGLAARVHAAVGAELDALEAVLAEPVTLPEVAVPDGLRERVLAALEEAGLLFDDEALADAGEPAVPEGLLAATLGRLEDEGLVAAAAAPAPESTSGPGAATRSGGTFQLLPGGGRTGGGGWRRLAAGLLVGLGLGLATHALRGDAPAPSDAVDPSALASLEGKLAAAESARRTAEGANRELRGDLARLREAAGSLRESRRQATETSTQLAAQVARLTQEARDARHAKARLEGERDTLAKRAARVAVLEQEVARLRAQPKPEVSPRDDPRVTQLERQLAKLGKELETDRKKLHELVADRRRRRGPPMEITRANRIEVWVGGSWVPVRGKRRLEAGTILRGHGATNALVVGVRPYRLRDGAIYRVKGKRRLELLPTTDDLTSGAGADSPAERIPDLIRQLASGTPSTRARSYEALVELYWFYRDLDPGPGVMTVDNVGALGRGRLGEIADEEGPPALNEAKWWAWWGRIKSRVGDR